MINSNSTQVQTQPQPQSQLQSQPEHQSSTVANINNLLVNAFENHNVTIYGTWEEPLFKAKDIGDMLGLSQIRVTISKFDKSMSKIVPASSTIGSREQYFLTEDGLYELLYVSRKPLAKKFRTHVTKLLKEQRLQMGEQIQKDMELNAKRRIAQERENHLKEKHKNKSGVYFLKHLFSPIIKFGSSYNVVERLSDHKNSFGSENIFLDKVINSQNYIDMENVARKHRNTTFVDEKLHEHTEIIEYTCDQDLQSVYTSIDNQCKLIEPPSYDIELEKEREKSKQLELQVQILKLQTENQYELQTKQNLENVKKMELQFELQSKQNLENARNLELQIELKKLQIEFKNTSSTKHKTPSVIPSQPTRIVIWCNRHIKKDGNCVLRLEDVFNLYRENDNSYKYKDFKKLVEMYFKETYNMVCVQNRIQDGTRPRGYLGFTLRVVE